MSHSYENYNAIKRTGDHSIDFGYYEKRARCSRAKTARELFRMFFSDKYTSLDKAAETCIHH